MGARHRGQRMDRRVPPSREMRQVEHRKVRHQASMQLHAAVQGADPDELVLAEEVRRHAYDDAVDTPTEVRPRRMRHWKTPFWKRRRALRTERWQLAVGDLDL